MNITVIIIFFIAFFAILIAIGAYTRKWTSEASDFTIAGREVGMVLSTSGITAIAFAGTTIALAPSFAILYGFAGSLAWGGILAAGLAIYAFVFGSTFRRCGARTLAEWMEIRFDAKTRTLIAIASVVGLCGIMANNIASFTSSLSVYTGIPTWVSIAVCFAVMILFTYFSGLHAVNMTNLFQMIIGIVAIPLFMYLLFKSFGGIDYISQNWPGGGSWITTGVTGNSLPILSLKYPSVLTFITLMGIFLIWGSNYEYLRITSSRSERIAKSAYLVSSILQIILIYTPLAFIGLIAAVSKGGAFVTGGGTVPTAAAYGLMLVQLSAAAAAFMLIASMAASLSTASTALLGVTITASRDVYQRNFKPNATDKEMLVPTRVIMVCAGILTAILTFFPGGPVYLFAFANSWLGPPAMLVLLGVFWRRFTPTAAFWSVLTGMIVLAVITALELFGIWSIAPHMHMSMAGIIVTLAAAVVINLFSEKKYYGRSDWNADPEKGSREKVKLETRDIEVLSLIRMNLSTMVEIVDYMGVDSKYVTESIERLDRGGQIKRKALSGANFYSFEITDLGVAELPVLTEGEQTLADRNLTPMLLQYLIQLSRSEEEGLAYLKENDITSMKIVSVNSMLDRMGYIKQYGHLRRHYRTTSNAEKAIMELGHQPNPISAP